MRNRRLSASRDIALAHELALTLGQAKGKPAARRGRKASDLSFQTAGLPVRSRHRAAKHRRRTARLALELRRTCLPPLVKQTRVSPRGGHMVPANKAAACLRHAALFALTSVSLLCSPLASANTAPTITGAPPTSVMIEHAYTFQPSAADSDHDKLTFSISNKPWWATFSYSTGRLYGTPQNTSNTSNIGICVSDGTYRRCLPPFSLKVLTPSSPPVISGAPPTAVTAGNAYSFKPAAHDPNGLALTFGIYDKPSWLSFNHLTGQLSGTPTAADVGEYVHIGITASNGFTQAALR